MALKTSQKIVRSIIGVPFAILVFLAFVLPNDWQRRKPHMYGRIWTSTATDGTALIHYITEEERTFRIAKSFGRRISDYLYVQYSRYHLHSRAADTGAAVKNVRVLDIRDNALTDKPEIIGSTTGTLWVWNSGLEARDSKTLAVRISPDELHKRNSSLTSMLPKDRQYYKASKAHDAVIVKGTDTEFYHVDPESGKISPADTTPMEALSYSKTPAEGFTYLPVAGASVFHTSPNSFMINAFLTRTGERYVLLTREQRKDLNKWPGKGDRPWGDVSRSLYKMPYTLDHKGEVEIDPVTASEVGRQKFVQGGFLVRGEGHVWDVPDPSSTLVLCKDALGEGEPWQVVRLARDGTVVWKQSTGLIDFGEIADAGNALVFYGREKPVSTDLYASDKIVSIKTKDGAVNRFAVATQPVE